jgi:hypothetical protein
MSDLYPDIHLFHCPITNGLQTTMTRIGYENLCKHHRRQLKEGARRKDALYLISGQQMYARCKECRGKDRPNELKIWGEE